MKEILNYTDFKDVKVVKLKSHIDDRGSSIILDVPRDFPTRKMLISYNKRAGTVRGIHVQTKNSTEEKIIWCSSGSILDVILDLRKDSPTYLKLATLPITEFSVAVLLPKGVAHGYQTLVENSTVNYLIDTEKSSKNSIIIDPMCSHLEFKWPLSITSISKHDRGGLCLQKVAEQYEVNNLFGAEFE